MHGCMAASEHDAAGTDHISEGGCLLGGVHEGAGRGGRGSRARGGSAPGGGLGAAALLGCLGLVLLEALALAIVLVVWRLVGGGGCLL